MEMLLDTFPTIRWLLSPVGIAIAVALVGLVLCGAAGRIVERVETAAGSRQLQRRRAEVSGES